MLFEFFLKCINGHLLEIMKINWRERLVWMTVTCDKKEEWNQAQRYCVCWDHPPSFFFISSFPFVVTDCYRPGTITKTDQHFPEIILKIKYTSIYIQYIYKSFQSSINVLVLVSRFLIFSYPFYSWRSLKIPQHRYLRNKINNLKRAPLKNPIHHCRLRPSTIRKVKRRKQIH